MFLTAACSKCCLEVKSSQQRTPMMPKLCAKVSATEDHGCFLFPANLYKAQVIS